ncbi:5-oxoprolinase subunit PxpB [Paenibacillus solisilvae]|uniref:5-oxoprolinase subunit PxpB n=1 Tax=Paenibacillus solisilvae TaxID=2486751 RepID=A0ABW0VQU5_9BACL
MNPIHGIGMSISPLGDRALSIRLSASPEKSLWRFTADLADRLRAADQSWIIDVIPAYSTVTVVYDPLRLLRYRSSEELQQGGDALPYERAAVYVQALLNHYTGDPAMNEARVVDVPVCYGGEYGPDLKEASERAGLSEADFAARHAGGHYLVAMIGFMPGFPYLTGLPQELSQPRRSSPRSYVPAGSVGIAGGQTGIYPLATPGGWQIIGRTPILLFDSQREQPSLLQAGDRLRFVPIDTQRMKKWGET